MSDTYFAPSCLPRATLESLFNDRVILLFTIGSPLSPNRLLLDSKRRELEGSASLNGLYVSSLLMGRRN